MKKLNRFDTLGQRQRSINWMFACDGHTIPANSRKRHVRLKRPFVGLPIGQQKSCAQGGDCIGSATVNPEQPGPSRLWPITRMLEYQLKSAEPAGKSELFDELQKANQQWLDRIQVEAKSASEFASKLMAARSIPDAMTACQEWASQYFELIAEDRKHLLDDYQKFAETGARFLSSGWQSKGPGST